MSWVEQVESRARIIHHEIANWQNLARELGVSADDACAKFYAMLHELYGDDMPLAKAKDTSDLLLHLEGRAVNSVPRISLVSNVFNNVKLQVRDLTKAIAGIVPERRVSFQDIDLGLSGLAKGSLFIGFSVPVPRERDSHDNLLGTEDPIYKATKDALRIINTVSHTLGDVEAPEDANREVAQVVDDPKVRDAALVAIRRMAPSNRQGVSKIGVTSASDVKAPATLTRESRSQISQMLLKPIVSTERVAFEGVIREIDLDAKRFELRGIANQTITDIRCIYTRVENFQPKRFLDSRVRVMGLVERRSDEMPRLLAIDSIVEVNAEKPRDDDRLI